MKGFEPEGQDVPTIETGIEQRVFLTVQNVFDEQPDTFARPQLGTHLYADGGILAPHRGRASQRIERPANQLHFYLLRKACEHEASKTVPPKQVPHYCIVSERAYPFSATNNSLAVRTV